MGFTSVINGLTNFDGGGREDLSIKVTGTDASTATGSDVKFLKSDDLDATVSVGQSDGGAVTVRVTCPEGEGGGDVTFVGTDGSSYTGSEVTFAAADYSNITVKLDEAGTAKIGVYYV